MIEFCPSCGYMLPKHADSCMKQRDEQIERLWASIKALEERLEEKDRKEKGSQGEP